MNKTFRSGASLHAVITDAPLSLVEQFVASMLPNLQLPTVDEEDDPATRDRLLEAVRELPRDDARRSDDVARRVLGVGRGRSADTLMRVVVPRLAAADVSEFKEGLDGLGRSLWTYLSREPLFEDAESLHHAVTFRDYLPIFASFDAPADKGPTLERRARRSPQAAHRRGTRP